MAADDDWTTRALARLEARAGRRSTARRAVVEHLGRQGCAVTAPEVEDALRAAGTAVGRATVYRVLEQLRDARLVQRLDVGHGGGRYEAVRHGPDHHHHLVCDSCGDVLPFADPALERAIAKVADAVDFHVADHDVVLHGSCGSCVGA
jgi:Fur family ferric uptake transcriptional regulator